jgi:hypothetical protein
VVLRSHFKQRTRLRILAACSARALLSPLALPKHGAGKAGRQLVPAVRENAHGWTTGEAGASRPSLRGWFNGFLRALLGGDELCCPRRRTDCGSRIGR